MPSPATRPVSVPVSPGVVAPTERVTSFAVAVNGAGATVKLRVTDVAGRKFELPACVAVTVTAPAPVNVRTDPLSVAEPDVTSKATGRFDVEVPTSVSG